jgi:trehalose 6-phosphate phosphatase
MRYLLSRASKPVLKQLARERTLCAFDFDGTLAPIVEHPAQAGLPDRTRELLRKVTALYPCVILSGRSRADLCSKVGGIGFRRVIGNHGAETESGIQTGRGQISKWKAAIEPGLRALPGVWVEDKNLSLAVHYRQSVNKAEARHRIIQATANLEGVRVFGGKEVVNLVIGGAPNKGQALAAERDRLHCAWVLYVGDDENDEDAFALEGNLIPVRIGRKRRSGARYYLRTQAEIDNLLELLVMFRQPD